MIRSIVLAPCYNKYTKALYKKFEYLKGYKDKIDDDYATVVQLLIRDLSIPDEYKAHKIINDIWELHLVSRGSDCLLVYAKRQIEDIPVLYIYAITDHNGLSKLVKIHGDMQDLTDQNQCVII